MHTPRVFSGLIFAHACSRTQAVFELALEGCHQIHGVVQNAVREHAHRVAASRSHWLAKHLGGLGESRDEGAGEAGMVDPTAFGKDIEDGEFEEG
jgi:hypothetical protein